MRVGVSGHQSRPGLDWNWVRCRLDEWLKKQSPATVGYSCLAAGADQIFGQAVVSRGLALTAILPFDSYERTFSDQRDLAKSKKLVAKSHVDALRVNELDTRVAFMKASEYLVDTVDMVIFIWDERPSESLGGTADVVAYAVKKGKRCAYLNPIERVQKGDWT